MYTIKQASRLTGVPEASLRGWERRYGVVVPHRNESGYRLYDEEALSAVSTMRRLVDDGWSPAEAADAVRKGTAPAVPDEVAGGEASSGSAQPNAVAYMQRFLSSAAQMDTAGIEESLDGGFALGSFEHVVDSWLFPTLEALGEGWARGEIDVAGEHAASHAVHRRLSAAYDAAGSRSRGPAVVVGVPPGSQHDLGALAFATAIRRRGMDVLYLGANVPVSSWEAAVRSSRGPRSGPVGCHSRGPHGRGRGGGATAQPGPRPAGVRRRSIRGEPRRWSPEPAAEHRGRGRGARPARARNCVVLR